MMREQWEADTHKQEEALGALQEALKLPTPPNRIECYDISTTQGTAIVASRVVFVQGAPKKGEYRRFNITTPVAFEIPFGTSAMLNAAFWNSMRPLICGSPKLPRTVALVARVPDETKSGLRS
jgi:hypothetical protein